MRAAQMHRGDDRGVGGALDRRGAATMRGTPATVAVSTDIWAEATIGNLPPGT
jgi:hypothetical protein